MFFIACYHAWREFDFNETAFDDASVDAMPPVFVCDGGPCDSYETLLECMLDMGCTQDEVDELRSGIPDVNAFNEYVRGIARAKQQEA